MTGLLGIGPDLITRQKTKNKIRRKGCFYLRNPSNPAVQVKMLRAKYATSQDTIMELEKERGNDKRLLLKLSGVVRGLQELNIDYDRVDAIDEQKKHSPYKSIDNIKRKIAAIDDHQKRLKRQCEHLKIQKSAQSKTISSQENRIQYLEKQIGLLEARLTRSLNCNRNREEEYNEECRKLREMNGSKDIRIASLEAMVESLIEEQECDTPSMKLIKTCKDLEEANSAQDEHIACLQAQVRAYQQATKILQAQNASSSNANAQTNAVAPTAHALAANTIRQMEESPVERSFSFSQYNQANLQSPGGKVASPSSTTITQLGSSEQANGSFESVEEVTQSTESQNDNNVVIRICRSAHPDISDMSDNASLHSLHTVDSRATDGSKTISYYSTSSLNTDTLPKHGKERKAAMELWHLKEKYKRLKIEHASALLDIVDLRNENQSSENASDTNKELLAKIEYLQAENANYEKVQKEFDGMSSKIVELEQEGRSYQDLKLAYEEDKKQFEKLRIEYDMMSQKLAELERVKLMYQRLTQEYEAEKDLHEKSRRDYDAISDRLFELERGGGELDELRERSRGVDADYEKLKQEYDTVSDRLAELEKVEQKFAKLQKEHKKTKDKILELEFENSKYEDLERDHKAIVARASEHNEMFQREFGIASKKLVQLEKEKVQFDELKEDHEALQAEVAKLEQVKKEYEQFKSEHKNKLNAAVELEREKLTEINSKIQKDHDALAEKVEKMKKTKKTLQKAKEKLTKEIKQAKEDLEAKSAEVEQKNEECESLKVKNGIMSDEIVELEKEIENYKELKRDHTSLEVEFELTNVSLARVKRDYEAVSKQLSDQESRKAEAQQLQQENRDLKDQLEALEEELKDLGNRCGEIEESAKSELEHVKQKYYSAVAKAESFELKLDEAKRTIEECKEKRRQQESNMFDLIYHYKNVKKTNEEAQRRIQRLHAVMGISHVDFTCPSDEETSIDLLMNRNDTESDPTSFHIVAEFLKSPNSEDNTDITTEFSYENELPPVEPTFVHVSTQTPRVVIETERKGAIELERQRDAAMKQMELIDQELCGTRKELEATRQHQNSREKHLQFVREQYEQLQDKYDALVSRLRQLKASTPEALHTNSSCTSTIAAAEDGPAKEQAKEINKDDSTGDHGDSGDDKELEEEEQQQQGDQFTSNTERDERINELERQLEDASNRYYELLGEHEAVLTQLDIVNRKCRSAQRDVVNGTQKKKDRDDNFRDIVGRYKKLEREHELTKMEIEALSRQLQFAKLESRRKEEEVKGTRKRLAGCHFQFKKLQRQYCDVIEIIKHSSSESEILPKPSDLTGSTQDCTYEGSASSSAAEEKVRLVRENQEIKAYCEELLTMIAED